VTVLSRLLGLTTDPVAAEVHADRHGRLGATNLGSREDLLAARDAALDRAVRAERQLAAALADGLAVLNERGRVSDLPATPSPEQLWTHVRTSEQGRKARALGKAYGRASRIIAEQRGQIARLRQELESWQRSEELRGQFERASWPQTPEDDEARRRDRAKVIDTVEAVLEAHDWDTERAGGTCACGWGAQWAADNTHWRHVAEQLAAVGALGPLTTPQPAPRPTPRTGTFAENPADTAKVGDNLGMHWLEGEQGGPCGERGPGPNRVYGCTRGTGHRRQHVATATGEVIAVWPNTEEGPA